jgi:hypothetical protein
MDEWPLNSTTKISRYAWRCSEYAGKEQNVCSCWESNIGRPVQSRQLYWPLIHCHCSHSWDLLRQNLESSLEVTQWELKIETPGTGRVKLTIRDNLKRLRYEGRGSFTCIQYCDMTPESRNNPLLDNGSLKHISAATDKLVDTRALLQN